MREFVSFVARTVAPIAVGLAWLAVWALVLRAFGIAFFPRQAKDRAEWRERIKQMGKLLYVLIFGMLGYGVGFSLAITTVDFLANSPFRWTSAIDKLVFSAVLFGWFQGAWTWSEIRGPVPFPPKYPPVK